MAGVAAAAAAAENIAAAAEQEEDQNQSDIAVSTHSINPFLRTQSISEAPLYGEWAKTGRFCVFPCLRSILCRIIERGSQLFCINARRGNMSVAKTAVWNHVFTINSPQKGEIDFF